MTKTEGKRFDKTNRQGRLNTTMQEKCKALTLKKERPVVGIGLCLGSVRAAEMAAATGFDYVMVDLLHSHYGKESATNALRALAAAGGPVPFGRVANNDPGEINALLDAGALGIIVPMVGSRDEAERAVQAAYYPPLGKRSKGSPAAVFYGGNYYSEINAGLDLIVMIETPEAAAKADEILAVPGVKGCLIGAGDLSFILQETGRAAEYEGLVKSVLITGERHSMAMGISVNSPEDLLSWWAKGADFFLASHDMGVLHAGIRGHEKKYVKLKAAERR